MHKICNMQYQICAIYITMQIRMQYMFMISPQAKICTNMHLSADYSSRYMRYMLEYGQG